jgi:nitrate reductase NapAB chaperone NapD
MAEVSDRIDVCGVLVSAQKDKEQEVKDTLSAIDGV